MNIGVDIRSLLSMERGGVPEYTRSLLAALIRDFPEDRWQLFSTGRRPYQLPPELRGKTVRQHHLGWPNKLANTALGGGYPKIDRYLPDLDVFLAPNFGFVPLHRRTPLVLAVHDLSFALTPQLYPPGHRLWHRLVRPRALVRRAAAVIAVSQQTAGELRDLYDLPASRITVIHSGINNRYRRRPSRAELDRVRQTYRLPERYWLFLGALEARKNIAMMLTGFTTARRAGLRSELILAGSGAAGQLPAGVRHLGFVPEADKPALYRLATGCVLVSRHEGFGFTPLEALAAGTPSIVSDLPVFRETLGQAAERVPTDDPAVLAEKLIRLEQQPAARRRLVSRGAAVVDRLTWPRAAAATHAVLAKAAKHHA